MSDRVEFKREIGLFMAVMIGIGAMMGPGIFALPGELAKLVGPLGIVVYLAVGAVVVFTALNYAELGAALPIAGGGYSFVDRTLPKPIAFLTGWFFWIGNVAACAMYVVIFALTIRAYFWPGASVPLIALIATAVFSAINLRGVSEALMVIAVMNLIELAVLIGIAIIGAFQIEAPNLQPFAPLGLGGFAGGMALVYISYVGFDLITVAAEEIIAPSKTIPRAILITLIVGVMIYVCVVFVMMGTVHHTELAETDVPFIFVAERVGGDWGRWAAITATIMASLSAFSVTLGASSRVLYALSRDGHFPRRLSQLHKRFRTPHIALAVCALFVFAFAAVGIVKFVASMADFGFLMGLGFVNYSVIALRKRMPNLRRPFHAGLYPWIPLIGIATCWVFVPALELRTIFLGIGLTLAGCAVYLIRPLNRAELLEEFRALGKFKRYRIRRKRKRMRVLIIGGGQKGQNIANRLLAKDEYRLMFRSSEHQITFIEIDEARCKKLEERYGVPIFQGDGTKKEVLDQVGLNNVDVAIAASEDDGRNVIAALQSKQLGMKRVIAIVQDPDYLPLLEKEGIAAISTPSATAAMVENFLDRPGVAELFEIGAGVASLVGVVVPEDALVSGKQIREIKVPAECVVAAVIRGKKFVVPRGDTIIEAGDEVVFVGPTSHIKSAQDLFVLRR
jgi:amino acid transporter/Trk K+ transport system NAD-binding subunit